MMVAAHIFSFEIKGPSQTHIIPVVSRPNKAPPGFRFSCDFFSTDRCLSRRPASGERKLKSHKKERAAFRENFSNEKPKETTDRRYRMLSRSSALPFPSGTRCTYCLPHLLVYLLLVVDSSIASLLCHLYPRICSLSPLSLPLRCSPASFLPFLPPSLVPRKAYHLSPSLCCCKGASAGGNIEGTLTFTLYMFKDMLYVYVTNCTQTWQLWVLALSDLIADPSTAAGGGSPSFLLRSFLYYYVFPLSLFSLSLGHITHIALAVFYFGKGLGTPN